ncbi:MAG: extracellular solute-binding protein [Microbacteriaceae bacterium]
MQKFVVEPFEKEHGIKVNLVTSAPPLATLAAQGDDPEIDLYIAGDPQRLIAQGQGLLQDYDPAVVTNAADVYDVARRSPSSVVMNYSSQGLIYDTKKVSPAPTSWFDLFDMNLPQQVVVRAPDAQNTISWLTVMAKELNGGKWPTKIEDYDAVFNLVKTKLKPNLLAAAGSSGDLSGYVYNQQAALAVHQDNQVIIANRDHGTSFAYVAPKEGALPIATMVSLTKTKNKYWAEKLMNFILDPSVQANWAVNGYYGPSNAKAEVPADIAKDITYGKEDIDKLIQLPWENIIPLTNELIERFNAAIS